MTWLIQCPINDSERDTPRRWFSKKVRGQVIPRSVSRVTKPISPMWHNLNFRFAVQAQSNLYPIGTRNNPDVKKITTQKWRNRMVSAINVRPTSLANNKMVWKSFHRINKIFAFILWWGHSARQFLVRIIVYFNDLFPLWHRNNLYVSIR